MARHSDASALATPNAERRVRRVPVGTRARRGADRGTRAQPSELGRLDRGGSGARHRRHRTVLKICIPIALRPEGGVYTFVGNLLAYLDAHGVAHTADPDADYDILFVNSWVVPYDLVRRAKVTHGTIRVVQRVD